MKKAFTIVELLVVMAVIGILITLAVVGIQAIQTSERNTVRSNDVRNVNAALQDYYTKYRGYPRAYDFIIDSGGTQQGVCIMQQFNNVFNGDSVNPDQDCMESSSTQIYRKIETSKGLDATSKYWDDDYVAVGNGTNNICNRDGYSGNKGTADKWTIVYVPSCGGGNVICQQYALYACIESGILDNQGSYGPAKLP
jgi:prepilin-type N-terminal cleavage/methylation domain-containing protein